MPGKNIYNHSQQAFFQQNGRVDRIIGDKRRPDLFRDCVELKWNYKWSNEFKGSWLLMTERMYDEPESTKTIEEKDGVITTKTNLVENKYFDIGEEATEHEFTLFKQPKNGIVPISFIGKGIDLWPQPALTKEYKAGWSDFFRTEIDVTDNFVTETKTGNIFISRPENIVNSYVLFNNQGKDGRFIDRNTGLDVNYNHGRLGHIERYCGFLPDGKKIWLDSEYKNGIITVKIPDYILKDESIWKAGFRIGPTFGYTATAATGYNWTNRLCHIGSTMLYTATTGDTITKFSILAAAGGSNFTVEMAAYSMDTASPPNPVNRLALGVSISINSATKGWFDSAAVSQAMSNGVKYGTAWVASSGSFGNYLYYDSTGTNNYSVESGTGQPLPATWTESSTSGVKWAAYTSYDIAVTFTPKVYFIN